MIVFKIDVIKELKAAGYNTNRLRTEKIIGESSLTKIRKGICPSATTLNTICRLLKTQPGILIEYIPDEDE